MSKTVIKVEGLSKQYRLGKIGTGSFSHDVNRWWHRVRGKEDPYLKIGETNDRSSKGNSEYVWSLRDIDFDIQQGDAVGIIGRNGAGKSTLLKILSRTTAPTTGRVKVRGRVASLLEVGTGFHPELTGRENIFLNGAILGMTKAEIKSKFDEIVDFAGVERYIDTPVKRYSSGMYVRLAFGVAAHLEPDILIVDEVLAVGDAEFQKKALGKMQDVSKGEGRTVLFVSHNIASIKALCKKGIFLQNGVLEKSGDIDDVIEMYKSRSEQISKSTDRITFSKESDFSKDAQIVGVNLRDVSGNTNNQFDCWDKIFLEVDIEINRKNLVFVTPIINVEKDGVELFWSFASDRDSSILEKWDTGKHTFRLQLPSPLKKGDYNVTVKIGKLRVGDLDIVKNAVNFSIEEISFDPTNVSFASNRGGIIPAIIQWERINR